MSQRPPQLDENLRSNTETGKDDDRQSHVHIMEQSEAISTRVYVGNLGYDVDDRDLYYFFYHFGPVEHARIIVYRGGFKNGFSKGFGFVTFHSEEVAKNVIEVAERDNIWMNGRMLRIGAARQSYWAREGGQGHARRRLHDKYSDNKKVSENVDTSDTSPAEYQILTNDDGSAADVDIASYQFYCYPTQTAPYPVYYPPPYPQIPGQDISYYPTPWHMSYTPTQPHPVPITHALPDGSYSSYQYQGAVLTEHPTAPYWEHQDNYMYMVTYDNTQSNMVQCGYSGVEHFSPTENHQDGFLGPEGSFRNNIQTYHPSEWDTGARRDYMNTPLFANTGDADLCDSGFQESVLETNESLGQVTAVSINHDEGDYKNKREGMVGEHERKLDPELKKESRNNVGRPNISEVLNKNSKGGEESAPEKNSAGSETEDCRKLVNNGATEEPCPQNTSNMLQSHSSIDKPEING